ncbi:MAG: ATP-dependent DNA helicase RecG [Candidatus Pacebacteria bacterium]|nr:ATP-dependent DNA helicase RecG [Candidatus Paceibacterota bacterium]
MISLDTPLEKIYGIGPRFITKFKKLEIMTVKDLIRHFPFRYEDFSRISSIAELSSGQQATIKAYVKRVSERRSFKKRMVIIEARLADETGEVKAVWFNQPYVKNILTIGKFFNFSGKAGTFSGETILSNPMYEAVGQTGPKHTARLVPIYSETKGITSKGIRYIIKPVLENLEEIEDFIPDEILDENKLPDINEAIRNIHFPSLIEDADLARKRFAFEDLFLLSILNLGKRAVLSKLKSITIESEPNFIKEAEKILPFEMTASQKKCLEEILDDIKKPTPMNRLLQGDVGSGKTAVAALAAFAAAKKGTQAAFMAPTEVLARQHFETIKKLFAKTEITVGIITGANKGKIFFGEGLEAEIYKKEIKKRTEDGKVGILIGTHSLIQEDVKFENLGIVIVDEQHRFGVEQRAKLAGEEKKKKILPHFLSMSATPIPRTLTLTIFGDLNLSTIDEMPKDRKEIKTSVIPPEKRKEAYDFIKKEVKNGRQIFVVCPRIEESEAEDAKQELFQMETASVKKEYEKLTTQVFPDLRIAMLHGKLKAKEKEEVMKKFKEGETDILVSTSVIEVGVDVPNATIMMIEGAERFGLAQIYQFRGRVGRGKYQSYCFLFTESTTEKTNERLKAILKAKNGFELAEKDLEIRGPGQFLGKKQTGMPDTAMKSLQNISIIKEARKAAEKILKQDITLNSFPRLREKIKSFKKEIHQE